MDERRYKILARKDLQMEIKVIIYSSNTGLTEKYAKMLSEKTGLPAYRLSEVPAELGGTSVIYMGWLMAGVVKDYGKAHKRYNVRAVCGVGLCDTGSADDQIRDTNAVPADVAVFTLQGGMLHDKLSGPYKVSIKILTKAMNAKKKKSEDDKRMIYLLETGGDLVKEENLAAVMEWWESR